MKEGTYTLILRLTRNVRLDVGKLGPVMLKKGYYSYTGSALGKAGFKRVSRYFEIASGRRKVKQWHIDYLLPFSEILEVIRIEDSRKMECRIASEIKKEFKAIKGFGSTDCKCEAHLHYSPDKNSLMQYVAGRYINITSGLNHDLDATENKSQGLYDPRCSHSKSR